MTPRLPQLAIVSGVLLAAAGCMREDNHVAGRSTEDPGGVTAQTWLGDFEIGPASDRSVITTTPDHFTSGEQIRLTMSVGEAPDGAAVTTYWYGPNDEPLGYETKSASAGQDQLTFTYDNTEHWKSGHYKAEVWVGEHKITERGFEIREG